MTWEVFASLVVFAMVPFVTVNPILYAYVHDWRESAEGKALMNMFIVFALLVDLTVLFDLLPNFPAKEVIAAGVLLGLLIAAGRFTVILVRELRRQPSRRSDAPRA